MGAIKNRQELYNQGKFFIRKRRLSPKGRLAVIEPTWAIYTSRKFGSWKLAGKFNTEEECDWEMEQFVAINDGNCILEN